MRGTVLGIGLAIALASGSAAWAQSKWYVSGSVGGLFRDETTTLDTFRKFVFVPRPTEIVIITPQPTPPIPIRRLITTVASNRIAFDPGVLGNFAVGYRVFPRVRAELEVGYSRYDQSSESPFTADPNFPELKGEPFYRREGGLLDRVSGTVNLFYDLRPTAARLIPYVGVGLGASSAQRSAGEFVNGAGFVLSEGPDYTNEAVALVEGGFTWRMSRHVSLAPAYRYVRYLGLTRDSDHIAKLAMRYSF